jgi:tryptophan synthase alpha chain
VSRIDKRFETLRREDRAGFIAYVMAGDPDFETSRAILSALPAAGADIIELGIPFSDPMADGPPIQRAALRALDEGMGLARVLELVADFRRTDLDTPIILMGYLNPVLAMGLADFARAAGAAGADGVIMVDCPPEEADPLADALEAQDLALIRLATPTTDTARLAVVTRRTGGFVYYVAVAGVTGGKSADPKDVRPQVERIRAASGLPVAVGFGIRTPAQAAAIARIADAAVVGSALVDALSDALARDEDPVGAVREAAASLSAAVRAARRETVDG